MQTLYPQIKPYARHDLAVEAPHVLYVDESGSPEGLPVVFIHGGPRAGCDCLLYTSDAADDVYQV